MTARFAWVSMLVAAGTALAVLLAALAFLPTSTWERFVPIATVLGGLGVLTAAATATWTGGRLAGPLRRIVQAIGTGQIGQASLRQFAGEMPSEVAGLLYALHHAQVRLHHTLGELEQDRAQMATTLQHMADGVLVLDPDERIALSNPGLG
jgi:signal transduction histidine kinase